MITEDLLFSIGAETKNYKANDIIFSEKEFPIYYFQIINGKVKLNNYNETGKEFIQNIFYDGNGFGETSLFTDKPYPINAVALNDCSVIRLPRQAFLQLIKTNPEVLHNMYKCLAERMYHKHKMLFGLTFHSPAVRLKLLLDRLKSCHEEKAPYTFQVPLTRQQLASLTGLCVETAIRTIKNMEKEHILKIENRKIFY